MCSSATPGKEAMMVQGTQLQLLAEWTLDQQDGTTQRNWRGKKYNNDHFAVTYRQNEHMNKNNATAATECLISQQLHKKQTIQDSLLRV